jgi:Protein of unknown function (DUF664)
MAPEIVREDPPLLADERTSLTSWLEFHRATMQQKCAGLSGAQMVQPAVPPSGLTLLGLVQHMTSVEWWWFEHVFAGGTMPEPICTDDDPEVEFHALDPDQVDDALAAFRAQCAHSNAIVAGAESLDLLSASPERDQRDLRWIMVHMVEEYARHNGHADLLRECIDGVVGD